MILWELNKYEPSKEGRPGDFYTELTNGWDESAYLVNFAVNGHKYACKVYAQTEEEALGIFSKCHPHLSYADLENIEWLEE